MKAPWTLYQDGDSRCDYFQDVQLNTVDFGSLRSRLGNKDLNTRSSLGSNPKGHGQESGGNDTVMGRKPVQGTPVSKSPQCTPRVSSHRPISHWGVYPPIPIYHWLRTSLRKPFGTSAMLCR